MNQLEFETRLNEVYKGAVKPLNRYVSKYAVLCFKCESCGLVFFGRPSSMVGKESQRHLCNFPYGDKHGARTSHVNNARQNKTKKKKKESFNIDQLNEMVWNDHSPHEIAQKLQVNPKIIKDYFKDEGLI